MRTWCLFVVTIKHKHIGEAMTKQHIMHVPPSSVLVRICVLLSPTYTQARITITDSCRRKTGFSQHKISQAIFREEMLVENRHQAVQAHPIANISTSTKSLKSNP
jgi:hypothetical protein